MDSELARNGFFRHIPELAPKAVASPRMFVGVDKTLSAGNEILGLKKHAQTNSLYINLDQAPHREG